MAVLKLNTEIAEKKKPDITEDEQQKIVSKTMAKLYKNKNTFDNSKNTRR